MDLYFRVTCIKEKPNVNPSMWWKLSALRFATLGKLAREVFSIQASSVASESAFSSARRLINDRRTRMSDESISTVLLLQSWNRHLRANNSLLE